MINFLSLRCNVWLLFAISNLRNIFMWRIYFNWCRTRRASFTISLLLWKVIATLNSHLLLILQLFLIPSIINHLWLKQTLWIIEVMVMHISSLTEFKRLLYSTWTWRFHYELNSEDATVCFHVTTVEEFRHAVADDWFSLVCVDFEAVLDCCELYLFGYVFHLVGGDDLEEAEVNSLSEETFTWVWS